MKGVSEMADDFELKEKLRAAIQKTRRASKRWGVVYSSPLFPSWVKTRGSLVHALWLASGSVGMLPAGKGSEQSQKGFFHRRCDSGENLIRCLHNFVFICIKFLKKVQMFSLNAWKFALFMLTLMQIEVLGGKHEELWLFLFEEYARSNSVLIYD